MYGGKVKASYYMVSLTMFVIFREVFCNRLVSGNVM